MRAILALLILLLAGCSSPAKTVDEPTTGTILGVVVDETITPILAANITVIGTNLTATTNATGEFRFDDVAPGSYVVVAEAPQFLQQRLNIDVLAGNTTQAKLQLPANITPAPFHQSTPFSGFSERHAGNGTQAISTCQCDFQIGLDTGWTTLIVEATWDDSIDPVLAPTEYAYRVTAGDTTLQGTSTAPLNLRIDAADAPEATGATIHLEPSTNWIYANQKFDVLATVWYGEPAPDGWRQYPP